MQNFNTEAFVENVLYWLLWVALVIVGLLVLVSAGVGVFIIYLVIREVMGI